MERDIIIRNQELTAQLVEKSIGAAALFFTLILVMKKAVLTFFLRIL